VMHISRDRRLVAVPESIRSRVAEVVSAEGPNAAAKKLGISRHTAVAVVAGMFVFPGTLSLLRESLAREATS